MINSLNPQKKAVLVTYSDPFTINEAIGLARAAGFEVVQTVVQKYLKRGKFGVGSGKAEEIKDIASEFGSEDIIFDEGLNSSQIYNLGQLTGKNIIDREKLILDIFALRATTTEAKLQVKLAELWYEIPRARQNVRLSLKGEKQGKSGLGEYAVNVRFRALKKNMSSIRKKLQSTEKRRDLYRSQRKKMNLPFVSLVGYTSSGKTTLFNRLTNEEKEISSNLFTTLGTTTRIVTISEKDKILLSDTVGFISRLPTYMIEAFKSTLDELNYADLILLLLDASEGINNISIKYSSCLETLNQLKILKSKIIVVLNKVDISLKEDIDGIKQLIKEFPSIIISAKSGQGIRMLKRIILENLYSYSRPIIIEDSQT